MLLTKLKVACTGTNSLLFLEEEISHKTFERNERIKREWEQIGNYSPTKHNDVKYTHKIVIFTTL